MSDWLIGRQEISDYARVSVWTVTAMLKAGLQSSGGGKKGLEPRTKKEWVDKFFIDNPKFNASEYNRKTKPRIRSI